MSNGTLAIRVGTTAVIWLYKILDDDGDPVDLTNATQPKVALRLRGGAVRKIDDADGFIASGSYTMLDGSVVSFAPTDGVIGYLPQAGDVDTAGTYDLSWSVVMAGKLLKAPATDFAEVLIYADI